MENFIVSARKYRPQTFDTVVGQVSITNTLKNAIRSNHLAQAFLFCGPRGVGKTTCARILAKTINCENLSDDLVACDQCESCTSFNKSASFNIHELDAASNNSVDDIRNLVDQVRIPPQVGKYKVYIIDEVHMLSTQAFNAFLKTLEEPPEYAKFILATTEKHKIIPTILSRCQIYDFKRITIEDIASHLSFVAKHEGVEAEPDALHIIAQKSDGALRDALSMFDQIISFSGKNITYKNVIENLNVLDYDYYFRITEFIIAGDISSTLLLVNEILDNGFDGQHFLIGMGEHLRSLLVCQDAATLSLMEVSQSMQERYKDQTLRCDIAFLMKALDINNTCDINYKTSNGKKLHLELALMQMCALNKNLYKTGVQAPTASEKRPTVSYQKAAQQKSEPVAVKPKTETPIPEPQVKAEPQLKPEQEVKKIPSSPPLPSTPGTTSIKGMQARKKVEAEETEEDLSKKPKEAFSQDVLNEKWMELADNFNTDKNFHITLKSQHPVLKDNQVIHFTVDNKIQQKEIDERKLDFLPILRKKLNNYSIQLEVEVNEQVKIVKPYTAQEKFKKMVEKNPALKTMKDQLNLEIDF
ncbi:DNA polymerase III subunit gamma/tau [Desulfosarcina sp.]|nr:DNA polymerase III subunit gamma/tau [Desulfosarcina sp.]